MHIRCKVNLPLNGHMLLKRDELFLFQCSYDSCYTKTNHLICNASDPTGFHISQKVGENMKLNSILFLSRVIEKKKKERKKRNKMTKLIEWGTWLMLHNKPAGNSSCCLLTSYHTANLRQLSMGQPQQANINYCIFLSRLISVICCIRCSHARTFLKNEILDSVIKLSKSCYLGRCSISNALNVGLKIHNCVLLLDFVVYFSLYRTCLFYF